VLHGLNKEKKMKKELSIKLAENGFIAYEDQPGCNTKRWAFESAETLADFIRDWGHGNTKTETTAKREEK